jgi:hypothetical protein
MKLRWITFACLAFSTVAEARTKVYAVVVAQNRSLDPGVKPLRYADDDGIKNWELLSLYADQSSLFVVADEETAVLHPEAVRLAEVPKRSAILERIEHYNTLMQADVARGDEPELFFVYAGHGDVDATGQGYINLHDGRLTRAELYRDVVAPSRARFVHVIIDACKSYFMVNSRGGRKWVDDRVPAEEDRSDAQVKAFLAEEQLASYPRAGVIVATSGDQETHEWARYQGGILSHELRSALSGAADVNGDGRVEYSELRAFLAAANARVRNPEARIEAFARAPSLDRHHPLIDLRHVQTATRFLHFAPGLAGRFHIEDDRGVRYADLNKESAAGFDVMVSSRHGYYIMRGDAASPDETEETEIRATGARRIELAQAAWKPRAIASRGALDQTFRQDLYKVPYGRGFYDGYVATSGDVPVEESSGFEVASVVEPYRASGRHRLSVGYVLTGSPAGDAGINHGVDLRYGFNVWGPLELGLVGQVGYGSGAGAQSLTRVAAMVDIGAMVLPKPWMVLRLDAAVGWQLLSGTVQIGTQPLSGTESRGLRFEAAGGIGFNLVSNFWLMIRGGLAVDGVYPDALPSATTLNGFLNTGLQFRL